MLLSILANLVGIYSLVTLPYIVTQTIDVSNFIDSGKVESIKTVYLNEAPYRLNNSSLGIKVTAQSAIIVDKKTGQVLWQKNPDEVRSIASITKLMSALVFLDHNPGWDNQITIIGTDSREGGQLRVYPGEKISVRDLFNASLITSSNSATIALARSTGLTSVEFILAMNTKAKELKMEDTIFIEPTGLYSTNVSTVFDIIKLASTAFTNQEIKFATTKKEYTYSVIGTGRSYKIKNTDRLLNSYLTINAGKTGFLEEAGYCLVNEIKDYNGHEIMVVVLGSETEDSRFQEVKALAQWTFDNYRWAE